MKSKFIKINKIFLCISTICIILFVFNIKNTIAMPLDSLDTENTDPTTGLDYPTDNFEDITSNPEIEVTEIPFDENIPDNPETENIGGYDVEDIDLGTPEQNYNELYQTLGIATDATPQDAINQLENLGVIPSSIITSAVNSLLGLNQGGYQTLQNLAQGTNPSVAAMAQQLLGQLQPSSNGTYIFMPSSGGSSTGLSNDILDISSLNPLKETDIVSFIKKIPGILIPIAGALFMLMLLYGGFTYMTAAGSDEMTEKAKNTLLWAVIGFIVVLMAVAIESYVHGGIINIFN